MAAAFPQLPQNVAMHIGEYWGWGPGGWRETHHAKCFTTEPGDTTDPNHFKTMAIQCEWTGGKWAGGHLFIAGEPLSTLHRYLRNGRPSYEDEEQMRDERRCFTMWKDFRMDKGLDPNNVGEWAAWRIARQQLIDGL